MMKKKMLSGLVTGISLFGVIGISHAALIVYHDAADFLANAGSTTVYDFESDAPGNISVQDFGDFSIDATGNGIYLAEVRRQNGNNDIYMNSYNNNASLDVLFDNDVTAFGFTYVAEGNQYWDHSTFSLNDQSWELGTPGDSGFFGVIETTGTIAAGTAFSFGQQSINWSGVSFDNVTYSSNGSGPVPEPGTMLLFGMGLVGLLGRKKNISGRLV